MPRSQSADESQHRPIAQAETRAQRGVRRAGLKELRVHAVRTDVDLLRSDSEREGVLAHSRRNSEDGVCLTECPLLSLCGEFIQSRTTISGLLESQRCVEFEQ